MDCLIYVVDGKTIIKSKNPDIFIQYNIKYVSEENYKGLMIFGKNILCYLYSDKVLVKCIQITHDPIGTYYNEIEEFAYYHEAEQVNITLNNRTMLVNITENGKVFSYKSIIKNKIIDKEFDEILKLNFFILKYQTSCNLP